MQEAICSALRNPPFAPIYERPGIGRIASVVRRQAVEVEVRNLAKRIAHGRHGAGPFNEVVAQDHAPGAVATLELVDIAAAGEEVGFLTDAADEEIVGLTMGNVAVDVAGE